MKMPDFPECCDPVELRDLSGRKGRVVGIANDRSLAWPAAMRFRQAGAELAITYVNKRNKAHVAPLAARLEAPIVADSDFEENAIRVAVENVPGVVRVDVHMDRLPAWAYGI